MRSGRGRIQVGYTWAEHTSEVELHVQAASELDVFEQALEAFAELVAEDPAAEPTSVVREVVLAAGDRAALLAAWLDELAYMAESEDLVPERVERLRLSDRSLQAAVRARRGRPRKLVKGVTYHGLTFDRDGDGFEATAVLDV